MKSKSKTMTSPAISITVQLPEERTSEQQAIVDEFALRAALQWNATQRATTLHNAAVEAANAAKKAGGEVPPVPDAFTFTLWELASSSVSKSMMAAAEAMLAKLGPKTWEKAKVFAETYGLDWSARKVEEITLEDCIAYQQAKAQAEF